MGYLKKKIAYIGTATFVGAMSLLTKNSKVSANELDGIQSYDSVTGELVNEGGAVTTVPDVTTQVPSASSGNSVSNFFKGYNPVTDEQMATGAYYASPFVTFFGNLVGFGMTFIVAWQAVQTVVDLLYWAIPPLRGILSRQESQQGGMGMGMGMGGMRGMQQQPSRRLPIFVSDDMLHASEVQQQGGMGMGGMSMGGFGGMGGYGGGMGGFGGGMGMGGQEPPKPKNILVSYFKKRVLSLLMLGVCMVVLFSSVLLDTGLNLGAFALKIIGFFNDLVVSNT